ncbi:MAG TPA: PA0069 family radical SAM protein [Anaeromyxobacteraceae bacterium]|nr:PA0069 family radical SAM protein [Anaeromyxobacteraceae bacterium]
MRPRPIANPPNPWESASVEWLGEPPLARLEVFEDATREILSRNDSPDVPFTWSVNPYRGCAHGCAYCYARPTHEYLGFGAGTDFETRIAVKLRAPELLRAAFERPVWRGEPVAFSGVTDPYQPLEAAYRLTRACLAVCAEYRNPVGVITKAPLVERDLDLLAELHRTASVRVTISLPFVDPVRARALEPWAASPARRLVAVERLARAGIPVGVNVAPVIPGLNDEEIPRVLAAAAAAGARRAGWLLLRLPGSTRAVFAERLRAALPERAERILHGIRETRDGRLYDARFGWRGRGEGTRAEAIASLFDLSARRLGFESGECGAEPATTFRRPGGRQIDLPLSGRPGP